MAPTRASSVFLKHNSESDYQGIGKATTIGLTMAGARSLVNMLRVCTRMMINEPSTTMCDNGSALVREM